LLATSTAIAIIALLRQVCRRYCGAAAVLRLWWILPSTLATIALPTSVAPAQVNIVPYVQRVAIAALPPTVEAGPVSSLVIPWEKIALAVWPAGAALSAAWMTAAQRRFP
jgi:beta-lactamase regulating signal transducer with metallopeptidase domain